jgi:hypothetical protein
MCQESWRGQPAPTWNAPRRASQRPLTTKEAALTHSETGHFLSPESDTVAVWQGLACITVELHLRRWIVRNRRLSRKHQVVRSSRVQQIFKTFSGSETSPTPAAQRGACEGMFLRATRCTRDVHECNIRFSGKTQHTPKSHGDASMSIPGQSEPIRRASLDIHDYPFVHDDGRTYPTKSHLLVHFGSFD